MTTRWFGEPVRRNEDERFLTGNGNYVDDIAPRGVLHAAVLRSPVAHARIDRIDVEQARSLAGVVAVWTWEELGDVWRPSPMVVAHEALTHPKTQYPLAKDKVNYVGEAVAFVVAVDRYVAEDACDLIEVDYDPLPAVVELEQSSTGDVLIHEDVPGNLAAHFVQQVGDVERAFAEADHVFSERLYIERSAGQPMETRAIVAQWDEIERVLTMWDTTQAPLSIRNGLAVLLGLPENSVRVVAPDVGGGFGTKIMMFYPEEVLCPLAAMRLNRPVKWAEDRREHLIASNHERGQLHDASIALKSDGTIIGVKDVFLHDAGAYTPYGIVVSIVTATQLPGPYRLPNYYSESRTLYTNKVPVTPYRGAGRPQGCYVMERLLDRAARELGIDRAEIRFKNMIGEDEFPWDVGLTFQDGAPTRYDSGNYGAGLRLALDHIGYAEFPTLQRELRAQGRHVGLGMASYVEGTGIGPYEGAHVRVDGTAARVVVATCVGTQGQGHQTSFAQIVADELGVRPDQVEITTGDSRSMNWGSGTYASRSAVVTGNAVGAAARAVREKAAQLAAELFEANPADIEFQDERVFVRGSPEHGLPIWDVAVAANPIRYAYGTQAARAIALLKQRKGPSLPEGSDPGLEARKYFSPEQATYASGNHAAIVEVDPETGIVMILKYVAVHDCGRVINPMIVEGQVHGGVAQGIGGAFYERLIYDGDGQPLSTTFMDFLIPTAMEIPEMEVDHIETPSPLNPLGIKGAGEAGVIPVVALMAQALEDALSPWNVRVREMPLNPGQIRALVRNGERAAEGGPG
jgi:aerobic carbon-monoxide dehydrogenase large subunit